MNKKIKDIQRTLEIFKELHLKNSEEDRDWRYRKLSPNGEYEESYQQAFEKVKEFLGKIKKDEKEKSFIEYFSNLTMFGIGEVTHQNLSWNKYVEIIEKSRNYLKYFDALKDGCTKIRSTWRIVFDPNKLKSFCSSIIGDFVDLIDIKEGSSCFDQEEIKDFKEIDKEWWNKNYNRVFYDCRALLIKHISKYLGKEIEDKIEDIEVFLQGIISKQELPKLLEDSLNKIIYQFGVMRNMLGKEEGETKKNKEWLRDFEPLEEKKKQLSTRITIDLVKTIHNLIRVLEE